MNNNNEIKAPKKNLRAGGYSLAITAVVIAIIVIVNAVVAALPSTYTKLDLTANKMYSLTDETKTFVAGIAEDINIYYIVQTGHEAADFEEFLGRYLALNDKLKLKKIDPVIDNTFVSKYTEETLSDNSLIIESAKRNIAVSYSSLYGYQSEDGTMMSASEYSYYQQMYSYYGQAFSAQYVFVGENELTGALDFVTSDTLPTLYQLSGHGETALGTQFLAYIDEENFVMNTDLSLLSTGIPEDADCIIINRPQYDLSADEVKMLTDFVAAGGNLSVITTAGAAALPNIASLAESFGLTLGSGIVYEGSDRNYYQAPQNILLTLATHDITAPLVTENRTMLYAEAHGITIGDTLPDGETATAFLTTTSAAYVLDENDNAVTGKQNIAVAVEAGEGKGKVTWFASPAATDDNIDYYYVSGANSSAYVNSLAWMCGKASSISIRSISLSTTALTVSDSSSGFWAVVTVAIIPLLFIAVGIAIWNFRRKR